MNKNIDSRHQIPKLNIHQAKQYNKDEMVPCFSSSENPFNNSDQDIDEHNVNISNIFSR